MNYLEFMLCKHISVDKSPQNVLLLIYDIIASIKNQKLFFVMNTFSFIQKWLWSMINSIAEKKFVFVNNSR